MRLFIAISTLAIAMLVTVPAMAAGSLASQINTLILTIGDSGCHFIRNGKTYTPAKSVAHIKKKYNYYMDDIDSIDKFIELSASKSLISGKPYYVMCDDTERQVSATWLTMKATELGIKQ
jgi:hypothetical protein